MIWYAFKIVCRAFVITVAYIIIGTLFITVWPDIFKDGRTKGDLNWILTGKSI